MNAYDYIDQYMDGTLDAEQKLEFERLMSEDEELQQMVKNYHGIKDLSEGILEMNILSEVESVASRYSGEGEGSNSSSANRWLFLIIGIILLSIAAYFLTKTYQQEEQRNYNFASLYTEPLWPVNRSGGDDLLSDAIGHYRSGDLDRTRKILLDSIVDKDLGKYWMAEIYGAIGQVDSVLTYLPTFEKGHPKYHRAIKLKIYALLAKNNLDEAREMSELLPDSQKKNLPF